MERLARDKQKRITKIHKSFIRFYPGGKPIKIFCKNILTLLAIQTTRIVSKFTPKFLNMMSSSYQSYKTFFLDRAEQLTMSHSMGRFMALSSNVRAACNALNVETL